MASPRLLAPQQTRASGELGVAVLPEHAPRLRVHREHVVRTLRDVHHAVHHERRRLPGAEHLVGEHPLELEVLHVARVDLAQQRVTLARVVAGVGQPVLRLVGRALQAIGGDLRECGRGRRRERRAPASDRARARGHHGSLSEARKPTRSAISSGVRRERVRRHRRRGGVGERADVALGQRAQAAMRVEQLHGVGVFVEAPPVDGLAALRHDPQRPVRGHHRRRGIDQRPLQRGRRCASGRCRSGPAR